MTLPKLLLIGASDSTKGLLAWVTAGHFVILSESAFTPLLIEKHDPLSLVIFATPPTPEHLYAVQQHDTPILLLLHADALNTQEASFTQEGVDYLIQPFHPQDLLFRLKKNALAPSPSVTAAIFDPSGLISQEIRTKWQQLGIAIHLFHQDQPLITFIKNENPDVVISDASIPTHNAETLIDTVKSRQIPLFSLFSENTPNIESNVLYAQADDYSVAPFSGESLLLRLKRILKKKPPLTASKLKKARKEPLQSEALPHQNGDTPALISQVNVTLNHEIRSPLTSILIGAQVIQKRAPSDSQEYQIAKEIEDASRRIQSTLDDFGQVRQVVVDDYINGIKMLNLKRSRHPQATGPKTC